MAIKTITYLIAAASGLLLGGCVGIHYSDNAPAEDLRAAASKSRTVTVLAKGEDWRSAGVQVEPGNVYRITASGRWNSALGWPYSGPDGAVPTPLDLTPHQIIPGFTYMALLARVGSGSPFVVGNSFDLHPSQSGALYFHINESAGTCGDNDGQMQVTTTLISQTPAAGGGSGGAERTHRHEWVRQVEDIADLYAKTPKKRSAPVPKPRPSNSQSWR